jgi:hypothetical protein
MWESVAMEVLHPRCAGLDVHKDSVVAAIRLAANGEPKTEIRTFATTMPGLLALSDWLSQYGCTHIAMEATGIYWKPVWHILADGTFTLILTNPCQKCPRPQHRRGRCPLARRFAGAWFDPRQLRAGTRHSGHAWVAAHTQAVGA